MKVRVKIIGLLGVMILIVSCILGLFKALTMNEMQKGSGAMLAELDYNAERNVRQELINLAENSSNYIITLEAEIDKNMLNGARVLYELDRLSNGGLNMDDLERIKLDTGMSDLYLTDVNGIFTLSTEPMAIGLSLFDIWDGYRMLITGESVYLPSGIKVKEETGEIFKFTAIPRANNRGILESALDVNVIEDHLQRFIETNKSIRSMNFFDVDLMTLTSSHADWIQPVYTKGIAIAPLTTEIDNFFNVEMQYSSIPAKITMDRQNAQIYYPVIDDGRVRYVLFIDLNTTGYFAMQTLVGLSIADLVGKDTRFSVISLAAVFVILMIFTVFVSFIMNALLKELEIAMEAAKAANRTKSTFLANMSHELRTPLNAVIGFTDLILENNSMTGNDLENLKKIGSAGATLLGIVNDILDFSRVETGKFALKPDIYQTSSLLNDVIILMAARLKEKPIIFKLNIPDDLLCNLNGDDLRIKQIFNNLLSNAFKYTRAGEIELTVNCIQDSCDRESVWMEIIVSDTGIGMSEEDTKKLFSDYFQVDSKANREIEGTGLGLPITGRFVEMMDGEITVESELHKGSVFRARIRQGFVDTISIGPAVAEDLRNFRYFENNINKGRKTINRLDLSYARALVVDDMQTNLDIAAGLLRMYKMQVDCINNGMEALQRLKKGEPKYNIVFMDHMMPGMDGIETTAAIRKLDAEYTQTIPIIALTANAIQGTEDMFYTHGFQAFISKPIDIINLDSIIQKYIQKEQM